MGSEARAGLSKARRVIVKLGTRALMGDDRDIDRAALSRRLEELVRARKEGRLVVLVSSGAIGLGWTRLGYAKRPVTMPELQASASVGQSYLMKTYNELLAPMKLQAGQLLLTHEDFRDRRRYLNLRNCLVALHEAGALPVINENDSVSVDEIRFGDNDILAGLLSNAIDADLTVLFSDVDGVYDGDSKLDVIEAVDGGLDRLVKKSTGGFGSGGMASKFSAARTITQGGGAMVVAHGKADTLDDILAGRNVGTLFLPSQERIEQRKRWIAFSTKEAGSLKVDAGAETAILQRGKSLLPAGITGCEGEFEVGDAVVVVRASDGRAIAKGLTNYSSEEVRKIMGKKTEEISKLLGAKDYDEIIHRDNMVSLVKP